MIDIEKDNYVDLHIHTTASDGFFSSQDIIKKAKKTGLKAIAITDHDSVSSLNSGMYESQKYGLEFVPGIELSVVESFQIIHIIGLYIDKDNAKLLQEINRISRIKIKLLIDAFKYINARGIIICPENISRLYGNVNIKNLFDYIDKNNNIEWLRDIKEHIQKKWINALLPVENGIKLINRAGGLSFLAHPKLLSLEEKSLYKMLIQFKTIGLNGIECFHPAHSLNDEEKYLYWAKELDLLVSGGSDYHGDKFSKNVLGDKMVSYRWLTKIKEYKKHLFVN